MNLRRLDISNFLSIGKGSVSFDGKGLTLIEGKNEDSPSSISNGAGKSSIFEALYWVLYGHTKRYGSDGDAVVNRTAGQDCTVRLYFEVKGQRYRIERWRKASSSGVDKNGLMLEVMEASGIGYKSITKGTMAETQKVICDLIKMSELTFLKIASFGQGDVKPFASLTDKELKEVFEESLGLGFLSDFHALIRAERGVIEVQASDALGYAGKLQEELKRHLVELKRTMHEVRKFEFDRKCDIERANEHVAELKEKLREIDAKPQLSAAQRQEKEEGIRKAQEALERLQALEKRFQEAYTAARDALTRAEVEKEGKARISENIGGGMLKAQAQVGKPCKACGRVFTKDDIEGLVEQMEKNFREAEADLKASQAKRDEARSKLAELDSVAAKFKDKTAELDEQRLAIATLRADIAASEAIASQRRTTQDFLTRAVGNITSIASRENHFKSAAKRQAQEVRGRRAEIEKHLKAAWDANKRLGTVKLLEAAFSNGGLKSYLLDNVTPRLNELIQKNVEILDDMTVEVSTVKALKKKGQFREQFSISVDNDHGADSYKGNSGGEQQKVNLAIALAFNTMVREAHADGMNAIFLDEPFESLDPGSAEKVLELCKTFGSVDNVFLITHNDSVKELVSNVITVKKSGGMATIG